MASWSPLDSCSVGCPWSRLALRTAWRESAARLLKTVSRLLPGRSRKVGLRAGAVALLPDRAKLHAPSMGALARRFTVD
jgi:hypothetical protein